MYSETQREKTKTRTIRAEESTWTLVEAAQKKAGDQTLNDTARRLLKLAALEELAV